MSVGKQLWSSLFKETSPLNALPSNALADSRLFTNSRENTHEAQERYSNAIKDPIRDESPPFLLASQDEQSLLTDTLQDTLTDSTHALGPELQDIEDEVADVQDPPEVVWAHVLPFGFPIPQPSPKSVKKHRPYLSGEQNARDTLPGPVPMLDLIGGIVELNLIAHPKAVVPTSKANRDAADAFCMKFAGLIPVDFVDIRPYQHTSKYRSGRGKSRVQWGAQEHITANFGKLVGDVYHVWPAHIFTDGPTILAMRYGNGYIRTKAEWVKELKLLREVVINGNLLQRRRGGRNRENPCLDRADSSTFFIILS